MHRESQNLQPFENGNRNLDRTQNQDHDTVVDWHTKKKLKKAEYGINRNNKLIYITFILEFVVFALIIAACAFLGFK